MSDGDKKPPGLEGPKPSGLKPPSKLGRLCSNQQPKPAVPPSPPRLIVGELKNELESHFGIKPEKQHLFSRGKQLEDEHFHFDYKINDMNGIMENVKVDQELFTYKRPANNKSVTNMNITEPMASTSRVMGNEMLEKMKHCPDCEENGIHSLVERLQNEENKVWVFCKTCYFLEDYEGKIPATKEDLVIYGLPAGLLEHLNIYFEDIEKIVRVFMSEYFKLKYLESPSVGFSLKEEVTLLNFLARYHNVKQPVEISKNDSITDKEQLKRIHGSVSCDHSSQSTKTEYQLTTSEKQLPKSISSRDSVQKLAETLVDDIPTSYQEDIKTALSKIEGYNFPDDFENDISPERLPLRKLVADREREMKIPKVETKMDKDFKDLLGELGFSIAP